VAGRKRLSVAERALPLCVEAFAGAREQGLQIEPRFGVEAGEELVEVDVRGGLGDRDHFTALELPRRWAPGADLDRDVLQCRLRAQQQRGVVVEARVLGGDAHRHRRDPVVQFDALDFADLGACDRDRLPLTGGDRLRSPEVGLQRVEVLAQDGHPPG
jgi:hypothetical protein